MNELAKIFNAMGIDTHDVFRALDVRSLAGPEGVIYDVKGVLPREIIDARL